MIIIQYVQLALLIVGCVILTVTDLYNGKIANKIIIVMCSLGIILDVVAYGFLEKGYVRTFFENILWVILIGILLYAAKVWAGGDTKLILAIALLFPAGFYWKMANNMPTLWIIIAFSFIFGYIFVILESIGLLIKHKKHKSLKEMKVDILAFIKRYARTITYIALFNLIMVVFVLPHLIISNLLYTALVISVVILVNRVDFFKKKPLVFTVLGIDIVGTIITGYIPLSARWYNYILIFILMLFRSFVDAYNYQTIKVSELKKGHILSSKSSILLQNVRMKNPPRISDETLKSRLTEEEANTIVTWGSRQDEDYKLVIVRKIPYAIFLLLGVISYLLVEVFR